MPMIGTIVNAVGVVIAGILGMTVGKFLTKRYQDTLMTAIGLATTALALGGIMSCMLITQADGTLTTQGTMMMIITLALGALVGEWINLDRRMEQFGAWLKEKTGNSKDADFINAFVSTSLTICIGAMAVVGSINDALLHDPSVLFTKTVLDIIIVVILTASLGKGCIFSAIPILIFEGGIEVLAGFLRPVMTDAALANLSYIGNVLILCVGINIMFRTRIKVANLLPALAFAVIWAFTPWQ